MASSLVVFTVFFGPLPPWLPLTLLSMARNRRVSFIVISDAKPPSTLPSNVFFETITWDHMQSKLSELVTPGNASSVKYFEHYKANDIKPLAPALYPHRLVGHDWWAWADLDMIYGDILKFMALAESRPACCRVPMRRDGTPRSKSAVNVYLHSAACPCESGETANVVCPLYPNPWTKKAWGPFTAFRTNLGTELYAESPQA